MANEIDLKKEFTVVDESDKERLIKEANTALKDITTNLEDDTRTRLKESAFCTVYIPMFLDKSNIPEGETLNSIWNNVAMGLTNEVVIVDEEENEVAIVPPLIKRFKHNQTMQNLNIKKLGDEYINQINSGKGALARDIPGIITASMLETAEVDNESESEWIMLWDRYLIFDENKEQTEDNTDNDDMVEY